MPLTTGAGELERSRHLVLGEILARNARRCPDRTALIFGDQSLTYAEMDARVNRLANVLTDRGVQRGDKVAVLMYNRLEMVEAFFACHKLGVTPVPMNFRLMPNELRYLLENSDAVAVLTDVELEALTLTSTERISPFRFVLTAGLADGQRSYEAALANASNAAPDVIVADDELAFLMYTSGTTGRPKGAMLTHRNLVVNTLNWIIEMNAGSDDVWLSGLPLFHIGGINGLLPFLYLGTTSVITASTQFNAADSLRLIERHRATMCYFVPTQWLQICSLPEVSDVDTSQLRRGLWGASQAPIELLARLAETFPSVGIVNAFGQTEMSSNTFFLKPEYAMTKRGSVGRPAVNVEFRIVDEIGSDVVAGDIGEIVYRGPTVMSGYYKDDAATADAFRDGWFHSGDLVREDDDGFIYVVDRAKDMIISGGENIYPAEVERALAEHPAIRDVAVFGVSHPRWVETPVAAVVSANDDRPTSEELLAFVQERLASFKKPSAIVFVEDLPRNAAGKLLKGKLRESYGHLFD